MADTTKTVAIGADLAPLNASLAAAAKTLQAFADGPVANAGLSIERSIGHSFHSVSATIARAAISGKTSMDQLVTAILADFDRIAVKDFIAKPVESVIASIAGSLLPISGARAAGGPVSAGAAYLVGENGPELFTPNTNGAIAPNAQTQAPQRPQIVLNVQAKDAHSFLKSESQIAAMMSRALARGQRNM